MKLVKRRVRGRDGRPTGVERRPCYLLVTDTGALTTWAHVGSQTRLPPGWRRATPEEAEAFIRAELAGEMDE